MSSRPRTADTDDSEDALTGRQLAVLRVIAETPRPLCIAEVADRADITPRVAGETLMDFWRREWADRRWGGGTNESKRLYPVTDQGVEAWRDAKRRLPEAFDTPMAPEWAVACTASTGKRSQVFVRAVDGRVVVQPPPGGAFELTGGQLADYRAALASASREAGKELAEAQEAPRA